VTEVPDHLLKRSRDRRSALGLGGGDGGDGGAGESAAKTGAAAPSTAVEPATATTAAKPAAATPAEVAPAPEPLPAYVEAALKRKKIPLWAMPVLALLPVWAIIYATTLSPSASGKKTQLQIGQETFVARCASCHGADGAGGAGRVMKDGELLKTFPDIQSQLAFVWLGSSATGPAGTPYGNPNREGGQHKTLSYNGSPMPAFKDVLKPEELLSVVRYEREVLSGEKLDAKALAADGTRNDVASGKPLLSAAGELTASDGTAMFGADGKLTPAALTDVAATPKTGG